MSAVQAPPVDLILHIGSGKTGTSSVQAFLRANETRLADTGVLLPRSPGRTRHVRLGLAVSSDEQIVRTLEWRRSGSPDPADLRRQARRRLLREIRVAGLPRVLLSDEALFGSTDASMRRLRRLVDRFARSVRIVVYLRRQDEHLVSRYQQVVKTGSTERLEVYARRDHSTTYDYDDRLSRWHRLLEPTDLVVRPFEQGSFEGGSIYQDFLSAAGIDLDVGALEPVHRRNDSLDAESVELLRILNLHRFEEEGAPAGRVDNRSLFLRLAEHAHGPTLTLPEAELDAFMNRWSESNQQVARRFLSGSGDELFRDTRRATATTTRQVLDPARLDHFFGLLAVPEPHRAAIRRIAAREAART